MALDQRDLRAQPGRSGRGHEPGGSRSDDDQVVALRRERIAPTGRMDALEQRAVVHIVGNERGIRARAHGTLLVVFARGYGLRQDAGTPCSMAACRLLSSFHAVAGIGSSMRMRFLESPANNFRARIAGASSENARR